MFYRERMTRYPAQTYRHRPATGGHDPIAVDVVDRVYLEADDDVAAIQKAEQYARENAAIVTLETPEGRELVRIDLAPVDL